MVGAAPVGQVGQGLLDGRYAGVGRRRAQHGTGLLGQAAAFLDDVQTDGAHSRGDQQPDRQLANQTKPDDARGIAQLDLGAANAVHGDRPDGGEGGVLG